MPVPPKPAEQRQRRNKRDIGKLVPIQSSQIIPKPPDGLLAVTKEAWTAYWHDPISQIVTEATMPVLHRLFGLYDELDRIWKFAREHRLTTGSQGQEVLNPLYAQSNILRAEIRQLEDRFGLTPMSKLKLGVKVGEVKRSLADEIDGEVDAHIHQDEVDAIDAEIV